MNICGNTCHMDCNGHRNCLMARYNWCNFGKLGLMLGFGQRKYPLLPFVIGLFTHAIFFTPAFHSQSAIPAFRDPPGPHSQLVLLIQLLQFCTHNKNHPRIADSTRESRILSATIREYCVTLSFCAQVAVSFDGYFYNFSETFGILTNWTFRAKPTQKPTPPSKIGRTGVIPMSLR